MFLASNVAYDAIKVGANALLLRPFLSAYARLLERNPDKGLDLESLKFVFADAEVAIDRLQPHSISEHLGKIMVTLASVYETLATRAGEMPFGIHVPVFEDTAPDALSRFRVLLDVDETITPSPAADYFRYWGLEYDYAHTTRVFAIERRLCLDEEFISQNEWERRLLLRHGSQRANG